MLLTDVAGAELSRPADDSAPPAIACPCWRCELQREIAEDTQRVRLAERFLIGAVE